MFRYLLVLPDGSPAEPATMLITPVPNWKVGEMCMVDSGDRFRILATSSDIDAAGLEVSVALTPSFSSSPVASSLRRQENVTCAWASDPRINGPMTARL